MDIMTQPTRTLIGIEARASNDDPQAIGAVWQRFIGEELASRIAQRIDNHLVAVYCEYDGDHTQPYTFFLGCVVEDAVEPPEGFTALTIAPGRYARFAANGPMPAALMNAWAAIWDTEINRAYQADFEIHDPSNPESVEIFVGIA